MRPHEVCIIFSKVKPLLVNSWLHPCYRPVSWLSHDYCTSDGSYQKRRERQRQKLRIPELVSAVPRRAAPYHARSKQLHRFPCNQRFCHATLGPECSLSRGKSAWRERRERVESRSRSSTVSAWAPRSGFSQRSNESGSSSEQTALAQKLYCCQ